MNSSGATSSTRRSRVPCSRSCRRGGGAQQRPLASASTLPHRGKCCQWHVVSTPPRPPSHHCAPPSARALAAAAAARCRCTLPRRGRCPPATNAPSLRTAERGAIRDVCAGLGLFERSMAHPKFELLAKPRQTATLDFGVCWPRPPILMQGGRRPHVLRDADEAGRGILGRHARARHGQADSRALPAGAPSECSYYLEHHKHVGLRYQPEAAPL